MKADKLVVGLGANLVGRRVITQAIGDYPGGEAVVVEIWPDEDAPEIAFTVRHPTYGEIGVFKFEDVVLIIEDPTGAKG